MAHLETLVSPGFSRQHFNVRLFDAKKLAQVSDERLIGFPINRGCLDANSNALVCGCEPGILAGAGDDLGLKN